MTAVTTRRDEHRLRHFTSRSGFHGIPNRICPSKLLKWKTRRQSTLITLLLSVFLGHTRRDEGNRAACGLGLVAEYSGVDLRLRGQDIPSKRNGSRTAGT